MDNCFLSQVCRTITITYKHKQNSSDLRDTYVRHQAVYKKHFLSLKVTQRLTEVGLTGYTVRWFICSKAT